MYAHGRIPRSTIHPWRTKQHRLRCWSFGRPTATAHSEQPTEMLHNDRRTDEQLQCNGIHNERQPQLSVHRRQFPCSARPGDFMHVCVCTRPHTKVNDPSAEKISKCVGWKSTIPAAASRPVTINGFTL